MIPTANQSLTAQVNFLTGQSVPNTLGGVGPPVRKSPLRRLRIPAVALMAAVLAALAFVLVLWPPA